MVRIKTPVSILIALLSLTSICHAQSRNLLKNPDAYQQREHWRTFGEATVEDSCSCFVVRNGGYFLQDVELPDDAVGQYALFIGHGASERINSDGAITGLPYLYGYMMEAEDSIVAYIQEPQMRAQTTTVGEWTMMWGIVEVPAKTKKIRFFLNQALRNGVPHNGSAARFTDLGLYLFATEKEARAFVTQYRLAG